MKPSESGAFVMSQQPLPQQNGQGPVPPTQGNPPAARWVLWTTVGFLIAAAVIGGFFIIAGDGADIAGRVWLTFILVMIFAGAVILDVSVDGPNRWYVPASTITNVILLLAGLLKIWTTWLQLDPDRPNRLHSDYEYSYRDYENAWNGPDQFFRFMGLIIVLRVALLITQVAWSQLVVRSRRPATQWAAKGDLILFWITAVILALPMALPGLDWPRWWWRIAGAALLAAVIIMVIPVVFRAFEPKQPKPLRPQFPQQYVAGPPLIPGPQQFGPGPQPFVPGPQPQQPPTNPQPWPGQFSQPNQPGQPGPAQPGPQHPGPNGPGPSN
jgi:hypothetical protein